MTNGLHIPVAIRTLLASHSERLTQGRSSRGGPRRFKTTGAASTLARKSMNINGTEKA